MVDDPDVITWSRRFYVRGSFLENPLLREMRESIETMEMREIRESIERKERRAKRGY